MVSSLPTSRSLGKRLLPSHPLDLAFGLDTGNDKANHMLLHMARLGNRSHRCFASQARLATRCGFSVSTASRAIRYLVKHGYIKQIYEHPRRRQTNTYELLIKLWITQRPVAAAAQSGQSGCRTDARQTDRQNHNHESGRRQECAFGGVRSLGELLPKTLESARDAARNR